jgi:hypothetical protein
MGLHGLLQGQLYFPFSKILGRQRHEIKRAIDGQKNRRRVHGKEKSSEY